MYSQTIQNLLGSYATFQANKQKKSRTVRTRSAIGVIKPILRPLQRHRAGFTAKIPIIKNRDVSESDKLHNLVEESHHPLLIAKTIFPFVLFPDTIHIDRQKLTIVHKYAFSAARTISVPLDDILNVEGNVGPLFGSVILTSKYFKNNTQSINYLWRKDVTKIRFLLEGYMVARHEKINFSTIPAADLLSLLTELGRGSSTAQ